MVEAQRANGIGEGRFNLRNLDHFVPLALGELHAAQIQNELHPELHPENRGVPLR